MRPSHLLAGLALVAAACGGVTPPGTLQERGVDAVAAALALLPSDAGYQTEVLDFAAAALDDGGIRQGGAWFGGGADAGFSLAVPTVCGADAPASCASVGSRAHLRLQGSGEVHFDAPRRVLGLHLALSTRQVTALETLSPQAGPTVVLLLPEFHVLLTGLDGAGLPTRTVRAIPAAATYARTRVDRDWTWVDTSLLGEVHGLRVAVESPIAGLDSVLVDNLTTSVDYRPDEAFFTIALLPDTQKYSETEALLPLFEAQARYLAASVQAEHLVFVSHLGDIVEHGDVEAEWVRADAVLSLLMGAVPLGLVVGNHDYADQWARPELGAPRFLAHFPPSRFAAAPWWVGASADGLSSAQRFPTPVGDFLYLHLSVDSPPPTVAWARSILDAHPGVPTLVTTHAYLREDGRIPVPYLSAIGGPAWTGISADQLFATLVAPSDQIFMVTCGHISAESRQVSINAAGHPVHELLQDFQNRVSGGEGFLRLLRFYPGRREIRVLTYSPWLETYEVDEDGHFTLPLDARVR